MGEQEVKRSPLKKRNAKRQARAFSEDFGSPERVTWIQAQPCAICGRTPSECAHVRASITAVLCIASPISLRRSRGAGGKAADIVPLCSAHHHEQHVIGRRSFEALHKVNLRALADATERRWTILKEDERGSK